MEVPSHPRTQIEVGAGPLWLAPGLCVLQGLPHQMDSKFVPDSQMQAIEVESSNEHRPIRWLCSWSGYTWPIDLHGAMELGRREWGRSAVDINFRGGFFSLEVKSW